MSLLLQDSVVTLVSLGAALLIVQRLFSAIRPRRRERPCANCDRCPSPLTGSVSTTELRQ